ncbi:MAG: NusG domain II-containing protein [Lachnospiraceae bacterium]|nr:NusG domain II-containing protein [Lachnospiraceae bacterium]
MSNIKQGNTEKSIDNSVGKARENFMKNSVGDCLKKSNSGGEKGKLIKKSDIILFVSVILIAVLALLYIMSTRNPGARVEISFDGEVVETFELSEDREHKVTTEKGNNLILIKNGTVDVIEADCPDKICVKHTNIKNAGETIICLPHKLVIEIVE